MISIEFAVHLYCSNCHPVDNLFAPREGAAYAVYRGATFEAVREKAEREGWVFLRRATNVICLDCALKHKRRRHG